MEDRCWKAGYRQRLYSDKRRLFGILIEICFILCGLNSKIQKSSFVNSVATFKLRQKSLSNQRLLVGAANLPDQLIQMRNLHGKNFHPIQILWIPIETFWFHPQKLAKHRYRTFLYFDKNPQDITCTV